MKNRRLIIAIHGILKFLRLVYFSEWFICLLSVGFYSKSPILTSGFHKFNHEYIGWNWKWLSVTLIFFYDTMICTSIRLCNTFLFGILVAQCFEFFWFITYGKHLHFLLFLASLLQDFRCSRFIYLFSASFPDGFSIQLSPYLSLIHI